MLSIIVRENLHDKEFLAAHCTGFEILGKELLAIDVSDYAKRADVPFESVKKVARDFATAENACVRVDLGTQHTLHTTLNAYLEKLLYLVTGNFGKRGGNNLHTSLIPLVADTDERKKGIRTAKHKMFPIGGLYPPNILPDEINHAGEDRIRAVWVDSSNPVLTMADTKAYISAFEKLDLLVVVDVAMTETARLADYVLPAASQFEKLEASGFNLEFPENFFHLRHALFEPLEESLPEPEIYTRLLEKMDLIPRSFPILSVAASLSRSAYLATMKILFARKPKLQKYASSIMYRTLGKTLPKNAAAAAPLLGLTTVYAAKYPEQVAAAGHRGNQGGALFDAILADKSGVIISKHEFAEVWKLVRNKDKKIYLEIPEMLDALRDLRDENLANDEFPFILMAGERRSYNANQIYRNPEWRKIDPQGTMRIHPADALELDIENGAEVVCESTAGSIKVFAEIDGSVRRKMLTLPNGYGLRYKNGAPNGPQLNLLTPSDNCEPLTKTPFHKHLPVKLRKA